MPSQTVVFDLRVHPELVPDGDLGPLMELLSDLSPILDEIGLVMGQYQQENFHDQGQTFGEPWVPLSDKTIKDRLRKGFPAGPPLIRTGNLESQVGQTVLLYPDSVSAGVDLDAVAYAKYHDEGTSRVPQRVLVALTDEEIDDLMNRLLSWIGGIQGLPADAISLSSSLQA